MPFASKPQAPISGFPAFVGAGSGCISAVGVGAGAVSAGGADIVVAGVDLDPHAAMNRVAAISFFDTVGSRRCSWAPAYQASSILPSGTGPRRLRHRIDAS